jgi:hypothetical protein
MSEARVKVMDAFNIATTWLDLQRRRHRMPLSTTLNTRSRFAVETGCGRTLRPSFRRSRTSVAGAIFVRFNGQG